MPSGGEAPKRGRASALVAGIALLLTACIGSIDQGEFETLVQVRGGGIGGDTVLAAVRAVRRHLGVNELSVLSLSATAGSVVLEVRSPARAEAVDAYRYGTSGLLTVDGLAEPAPVQRSVTDPPIEASVFRLAEVRLDRFDEMIDEALEDAELRDAYATEVRVERPSGGARAGGPPEVTVTVRNDRASALVTFASDGTRLEVQRL